MVGSYADTMKLIAALDWCLDFLYIIAKMASLFFSYLGKMNALNFKTIRYVRNDMQCVHSIAHVIWLPFANLTSGDTNMFEIAICAHHWVTSLPYIIEMNMKLL